MFEMLWRKLRLAHHRKRAPSSRSYRDLSPSLEANLTAFFQELGKSPDLIVRRLTLGPRPGRTGALLFIDGLVDPQVVNRDVLLPLLNDGNWEKGPGEIDLLAYLAENLLAVGEIQRETNFRQTVQALLTGNTILLVDGRGEALVLSTKGWEKRAIREPEAEQIILGPHEGFTENLRTNTALLRRKIATAGLHIEELKLGQRTQTTVAIAYLKGVVNQKLVEEVRTRLKRINIDSILDANYLHEFITDAPYSLFPTIASTERPDVAAAKLLEGRVAIFVDGTPVVTTVPALFVEFFQSPDDYNFPYQYATMVRWFRYLSFSIAVLAPAFFVALGSYHQELIPTPLLLTLTTATEGTPFPLVVEMVMMGLVFEILREAGVRLARPFGQTISIVGALVIGEAAVTAGLVGAPTIIVIALTAITTFVVPGLLGPGIYLRLIYTILAGVLGAYGILTGVLFTLLHLAALRSFGVPYMAPLMPVIPADLKDVLVRAPVWALWTRPRLIGWPQPQRQPFGYVPDQEEKGEDEEAEDDG
ncbi:MAG TPA: spore germination protein [Firmicutes bacterium]|uniref:Spore germination protein n=1 Tax=Capillibacterium thermochitinicola TaxID=2699427 RepID=A0A8J6I1S1_9FIRM|nr:spore germination protein [Capillibacterium thermochitinicola]MBA2133119.1 spore germination protein [Capillibacterium thermochitinicola]HHW11959.1 spore germination protein [Bacillota bacterium]